MSQKKFKRFIPKLVYQEIEKLDYDRKDDLYCIVDLIYRKKYNFKSKLEKIYGYVEIPMKVFQQLIPGNDNLNNALKTLISEGIIDRNDHYSVGSFSKSYKINHELLSKNLEVMIVDKNINTRIAKIEKEKRQWNEKNLEFAQTEYFKSFKIDYEAAYVYIFKEAVRAIKVLTIEANYPLTQEEIESIITCEADYKRHRAMLLHRGSDLNNILHRFIDQHHKILAIKNGYLYFKRNTTNGRLDTNLTNLPTSLRQFIISTETLYNIDIKNSQPYFFYSLLKTEKAIGAEELERYGKLVLSGTFYEYLADEYTKYTGNIQTRAAAKNMLFKIFFSKTSSFAKVKEFFGSLFPEIMEYINENNEKSNAIIANKLSTIESTTIISVILPKLGELGIKPFTIHDSFVCKESELDVITSTIREITTSMYGMAPNLHCKTLIDDAMQHASSEITMEDLFSWDDIISDLNEEI